MTAIITLLKQSISGSFLISTVLILKFVNKIILDLIVLAWQSQGSDLRAHPNMQMLNKSLFITCLLIFDWPKHITQPSSESLWKGNICLREWIAGNKMHLHFSFEYCKFLCLYVLRNNAKAE